MTRPNNPIYIAKEAQNKHVEDGRCLLGRQRPKLGPPNNSRLADSKGDSRASRKAIGQTNAFNGSV
jgi:hypothetical protein